MKEKNPVINEIVLIVVFTLALIFNAFLATQKLENRKQYEIKRR